MQRVQIRTAQNVFIEYPVAGVGDRIGAYFIDLVLMIAYLITIFWIIGLLNIYDGWVFLCCALPAFFYHFLCELLFNGQSVGKKQMKIKVVRLDGSEATLGGYILRWLFRIIDVQMMSGAVAIITIAAGGRGQRLGDLVAGTAVIKLTPLTRVAGADVIQVMNDDTHQVTYPGVTRLTDKDIALIKEVLRVNREDGNSKPVEMVTKKLGELLEVPLSEPPLKFLHTLVKDYHFLTSRN